MKPHLIDYYRRINEGGYSSSDFRVIPLNRMRESKPVENTSFDTLDSEIKNALLKKGWTQEKFDSISQQERDYATRCASI